MKNTVLLSILLLFTVTFASDSHDKAQEKRVKSSDAYRYGEAVGQDQSAAKTEAKTNLCKNIYSHISTLTERDQQDVNYEFRDSTRKTTKISSALTLRNVKNLVFDEGDHYRVIAYIDTASLHKSFAESKQKVRDMVKLALQAEAENRIGDALRMLYWSYLQTHTYVGELKLDMSDIAVKDAQMAIEAKMKQIVSNLNVKADPCYRSAGITNTTLAFSYKGRPVQNLDAVYHCGQGDDWINITNGEKAYITYFKELSFRRVPLPICLEYIYFSEMQGHPEILDLYNIFKDKRFDLTVNAHLIAPWIENGHEVESTTTNVDVDRPVIPKPATRQWSFPILILAEIEDKGEFQKQVNKMVEIKQIITASGADQLPADRNHFLALYCDEIVVALLHYDGNSYRDVRTGREYEDYTNLLPDEGVVSGTWIGELTE